MSTRYQPRPSVSASSLKVGTVRVGHNTNVKWVVKITGEKRKAKRWCKVSKKSKPKTKPRTRKRSSSKPKPKKKSFARTKAARINNYGERVPKKEAPSRQVRRLGRPSPSVSATINPVGKVMRGNDGNLYEVRLFGSRKIHRWVRHR